jgi:hypothetical protein
MHGQQGETDANELKDLRVLSVPTGETYARITEHNVYSCPISQPEDDESIDVFAPRNEEGRIPRIYAIAARIVIDPKNPIFPTHLKSEYIQDIEAYISVVKNTKGILDNGGPYRFYVFRDVELGDLKHAPKLSVSGPAHVHLSLKELLSGSACVAPL